MTSADWARLALALCPEGEQFLTAFQRKNLAEDAQSRFDQATREIVALGVLPAIHDQMNDLDIMELATRLCAPQAA